MGQVTFIRFYSLFLFGTSGSSQSSIIELFEFIASNWAGS